MVTERIGEDSELNVRLSPTTPTDNNMLSSWTVGDYSSLTGVTGMDLTAKNINKDCGSAPVSMLVSSSNSNSRKQREFIPDNKKDDSYWDRRRRNNEAAKRSREKRRLNDMVLETRVLELTKENAVLRAQLNAIKDKYGICGESMINPDQISVSMPPVDHVAINLTKRSKLLVTAGGLPVLPLRPLVGSQPPHHNQSVSPQHHHEYDGPNSGSHSDPPTLRDMNDVVRLYNYCRISPNSMNPTSNGHGGHLGYSPSQTASNGSYPVQTRCSSADHVFTFDPSSRRRSAYSENSSSPSSANTHVGDGGCSSGDESPGARSPDHVNRLLPHKLRHKSHLSDSGNGLANGSKIEVAFRASPGTGPVPAASPDLPHASQSVEEESSLAKRKWTEDEGEGEVCSGKRRLSEDDLSRQSKPGRNDDNRMLKTELQRLASEVATLKDFVLKSKEGDSEDPSASPTCK
uniref:BZIP domain-containing protein n=1 Tax=Strigamia maritima TaxID=126957 RepID=T1J9U8_STRMM